jgi:hypothetical protein
MSSPCSQRAFSLKFEFFAECLDQTPDIPPISFGSDTWISHSRYVDRVDFVVAQQGRREVRDQLSLETKTPSRVVAVDARDA